MTWFCFHQGDRMRFLVTLRTKPGILIAALFSLAALRPAGAMADGPTTAARETALQTAVDRGEMFWRQVAEEKLRPTMSCRELLGYALTLCEARVHAERIGRLLALTRQMQDQDSRSKQWGNLRWYWRDDGVTDTNAVEFSMHDALLMQIRHGDWLSEEARKELAELLRLGAEGCLRHRVPTDYTNIAILNAGNLIVLGERLHRSDAAQEGYRRLDAFCALTATLGVHEFCSPTYYGTDLNGLMMIEKLCAEPTAAAAGRGLAAAGLDRHRRELVSSRAAARRLPQPKLRLSPRARRTGLASLGAGLANVGRARQCGAVRAVGRPMATAAATGRHGAAASAPGPPALGNVAR